MNNTAFPRSFAESRNSFLEAATNAGWQLDSIAMPATASKSRSLATDIAYRGCASPKKLLVIVSGVHGVELMCGSGCQTALIESDAFAKAGPDLGILMIHAINPWGAVNLRRTNEDNIDLCRNCLDFSQPTPANPEYAELHSLLNLPKLDHVLTAVHERMAEQGDAKVIGALMTGQYTHGDGFNFGGYHQSWSIRTLMGVVKRFSASAREVAIIELHSGLGEYGRGMLVSMQYGKALQLARRWFGDVIAPREASAKREGKAVHQALGHTTDGYTLAADQANLVCVVLEFGTYEMTRNLVALIQDHWLSCVAPAGSHHTEQIKQEMLRTHLPEDPRWCSAVTRRATTVVEHALKGLIEAG